jgi:hypothetical protein
VTTPERKIRCIVHPLPLRNPCPNQAVSPLGYCAHHLAQAAAEYRAITERGKP